MIRAVTWVLMRPGEVLLEQCPNKARILGYRDEWFVPGGKLHDGEHPYEGLVRELAEEWPDTQLLGAAPLPVLQGSPVSGNGVPLPDAQPPGTFLMQPYRIKVGGIVPAVSGDGIPLRWVPIAQALFSPVPQVRMMVAAAMHLT